MPCICAAMSEHPRPGSDSDTDFEAKDAQAWATARTLAEALPFIQVYDRETVVIKYGGHAMGDSAVARQFAADVVLLKLMGVNPVVVHGGGPQISAMLDKAGVRSAFVDGLRVTDADTMQVAEMVLSGAVNKEIAHWITMAGKEADVRGVGLFYLLDLVKNKETREPMSGFNKPPSEAMAKLSARLRERGMYTMVRWDWVFCAPPLCITEEELKESLEIIDDALTIADGYCV